ncbi:MAG: hypothetical protein WCJ19_02205 [bacterium]
MFVNSKFIHHSIYIFGLCLFIYSLISSIIFHNPHFYTFFAVGSWLVMDYIDYKINKTSILTYFMNSHHRDAFISFFLLATVFCFVVDFVLGVNISKMWVWRDYKSFDFIIMFLFMNAAYTLGMYELFRLIKTILRNKISDKHLININIKKKVGKNIAQGMLYIGLICLIVPFYPVITGQNILIEYVMFFPFLAIILISDSITWLLGGSPILLQIFNFNYCIDYYRIG